MNFITVDFIHGACNVSRSYEMPIAIAIVGHHHTAFANSTTATDNPKVQGLYVSRGQGEKRKSCCFLVHYWDLNLNQHIRRRNIAARSARDDKLVIVPIVANVELWYIRCGPM